MCPLTWSISPIIVALVGIGLVVAALIKLPGFLKVLGICIGVLLMYFSSYTPEIPKYINASGRSITVGENVDDFIKGRKWKSNTYCGGSYYTFNPDGTYSYYRRSDTLEDQSAGLWQYQKTGFMKGELLLKPTTGMLDYRTEQLEGRVYPERSLEISAFGKYIFIEGQSYSEEQLY